MNTESQICQKLHENSTYKINYNFIELSTHNYFYVGAPLLGSLLRDEEGAFGEVFGSE